MCSRMERVLHHMKRTTLERGEDSNRFTDTSNDFHVITFQMYLFTTVCSHITHTRNAHCHLPPAHTLDDIPSTRSFTSHITKKTRRFSNEVTDFRGQTIMHTCLCSILPYIVSICVCDMHMNVANLVRQKMRDLNAYACIHMHVLVNREVES